ncbi:MAG: RNA polymerase sigma factor [Anaerolineae bacterium]
MADERFLIRQAQSFNQAALAGIYDEYSPRLYRYAWRLLGSEVQAEDCVADTFRRWLQALADGGGPRDHLQAYLYRIAHNWITDYYRREAPPVTALPENMADGSSSPSAEAEIRCRQDRVRAALQELTPEQRQVLVLKYLEELPNEEIARSMGKAVGAVKALQHRALAALRRLLPGEELL